jgi:hypothetical protein
LFPLLEKKTWKVYQILKNLENLKYLKHLENLEKKNKQITPLKRGVGEIKFPLFKAGLFHSLGKTVCDLSPNPSPARRGGKNSS